MEQLLRILPSDIGTWVKEHEPEEGLTAVRLALQYQNAHHGSLQFSRTRQHPPHPSWPPRHVRGDSGQDHRGNPSSALYQPAPGKTLICFYCQQCGHKASMCPMRKTKLTGACYAPRAETELKCNQLIPKLVVANGQQTVALLDRWSSTSLIKRDLVLVGSIDYSTKTDIICVHGDCHDYPKAEVSM